MAVLNFQTHQYVVYDKPDEVVIDNNGDPVKSDLTITRSAFYRCGLEYAGTPNTIQMQDGQMVVYSYIIHGGHISPELFIGQRIEIYDRRMEVIFDGTIKGYKKLQLQTLIWV